MRISAFGISCTGFKIACLVAGLSCFGNVSQGQGPNAPPDPEQMFRQLDANQDGKITLEEQRGPGTREFAQRVFDMAKKPATGSISKDEFLRIAEQHRQGGRGQPGAGPAGGPGRGPGPGGRPPRPEDGRPNLETDDMSPSGQSLLRGLDTDGNQRLSRAELRRIVERFETLDTNQDGDLDIAELTMAAEPSGTEAPAAGEDIAKSKPGKSNGSTKPGAPGKAKPETRPGSSGRTAPGKTGPGRNAASNARDARPTLEGVWRGWVVDGRGENPDTGHLEMELTISGNRMTARELGANQRAREGLGEGTFIANAQGTSGNLDASQTAGQHAGKNYPGIFELDGDTLKWCVASRNPTRPTLFETGRVNYFMILHRQK